MPTRLLIVGLAASLALPLQLAAQESDETSRETLRGVSAVWVLVESADEVLKGAGLGEDHLRVYIAARLRDGGIRVVGRGAGIRDTAPFLYLNMQTSKSEKGDYAFIVYLHFNQSVRLVRDSTIETDAVTWHVEAFGSVALDEVGTLRSWVDEFVDSFIQAYRAANAR